MNNGYLQAVLLPPAIRQTSSAFESDTKLICHILYTSWKNPSQKYNYEDFKKAHSDVKVSQRYFERLKPFFAQPLRPKDRNTCCCRKHVEARLLFRKCMDYIRRTDRAHLLYDHLSDVVNTFMCPKPKVLQYHRIECIRRTCDDCGVDKSPIFTEPLSDNVDTVS